MNKVMKTCVPLLLVFGLVSGNGQSVEVPVVVSEKVNALYPGAEKIEWEKERRNYEAEFLYNGKDIEILFDKNGNILESEIGISVDDLPEVINKQVVGGLYRITQVIREEKEDVVTYSVVRLTQDTREQMEFNAEGKLLSSELKNKKEKKASGKKKAKAQGDVSSYGKKWELPAILTEVSGIALIAGNQMACVQDELGVIFIYDLISNKIVKEIDFGPAGDYEGITIVGNTAFVLRSDGVLFEVKDFNATRPAVVEHVLFKGSEQNLEGLCYDAKEQRLLIVPRIFETPDKTRKGIYAFDLKNMQFDQKPIMHVVLNDPMLLKFASKKGKDSFIPSEIGVHPVSGNIYLTDARNGLIMVKDRNGNTLKVESLNKNVFPKTEGIAFAENGEVYLSNEGKKGSPTIIMMNKAL